jgi:hypothetical protein
MRNALLAGGAKITSALKEEPVQNKRGPAANVVLGNEIALASTQVLG